MKVIQKIVELQNELFSCRKENKTIGLVPTMGALHDGHYDRNDNHWLINVTNQHFYAQQSLFSMARRGFFLVGFAGLARGPASRFEFRRNAPRRSVVFLKIRREARVAR